MKPQRKKRKQYTPEQALNALNDISNGMPPYQAAQLWGVPKSTLYDLKDGRYTVSSRPGPSTVLTPDEELLLCDWMVEMCRRALPVNKQCLLDSVQKIIAEDIRTTPFINGRPGDGWFSAFLKHHPEISQRTAESISRSRGALTEGCIREWFADAQRFFDEKKIATTSIQC